MITNVFRREKQRDVTHRRGKDNVIIKAEVEEMEPQTKEWSHEGLKETKNTFSPSVCGGNATPLEP